MSTQLINPRSTADELSEQQRAFASTQPLAAILDAIPSQVLIVNQNREVVHANRQATRALTDAEISTLLGKRPGEALRCEHAASCRNGCGTGEACAMCGAANSLRAAERGQASVQECRIREIRTGVSMDYRVSTTPIEVEGQRLNLVAITDISHENRRRALERIFFHDLLNTLGALSGYVQLLEDSHGKDFEEFSAAALCLTETMAEQINEQRDLAAAEDNDLTVRPQNINARELLEQVVVHYRSHAVSRGRTMSVSAPADAVILRSDKRLLQRIVSNMLKNALEATAPGGEVTLRCHARAGKVIFEVHNEGIIPREVQLQMFNRAFSTKGAGRGLGTYSMKLLGERYLAGRISFSSSADDGTLFRAEFPQLLDEPDRRHFAAGR